MTATELVKSVALALIIVALTYAAIRQPPGLLSWPMYTQNCFYRFDLYESADMAPASKIDQERHIGEFDRIHHRAVMNRYIEFLREVHGIHASGSVVVVDRDGVGTLKVKLGEIVDI